MKKLPFKGSGVALVTPFTNENKIDFDALIDLINMHINHKTDAIVVCGTTGEASTLSDIEQEELIAFSKKAVNNKVPLIAGAGSNNTKNAVKKAKTAQKAGADAILSVTPFYNKANFDGIIEHYKAIAKAVDIPIILYNVPQRTGMSLPIEVLLKLSEIDNIVAIKEASGNLSYVSQIAAYVPNIYIYSGNDDIALSVMAMGGMGVISVAANIVPEDIHNMCESVFLNDIKKAGTIQKDLIKVIDKLFIEVNPIPVKNAMNKLGYKVGETRLPLGKMSEENLAKLMDTLYEYGVKKII